MNLGDPTTLALLAADASFEWQIEFTPVNGRITDVPSIFAAFEQQLGLRLRPSTGDIEVLIINSIEEPSTN